MRALDKNESMTRMKRKLRRKKKYFTHIHNKINTVYIDIQMLFLIIFGGKCSQFLETIYLFRKEILDTYSIEFIFIKKNE